MYDRRWRTGRIGLGIQFDLLLDPRFLVFENRDRVLGGRLDEHRMGLEAPMEDGWTLSAVPVAGSRYLPDEQTAARNQARWLYVDHKTRHQESLGMRLDPVFRQKRVAYQLKATSQLFKRSYEPGFHEVYVQRLYKRNVGELLELGVCDQFPGSEGVVPITQTLSLELHHERWTGAVPGHRKLVALGLGLWLLTRYGQAIELPAESTTRMTLDFLSEKVSANVGDPAQFDVVSSCGLLLDGYLAEVRGLTFRRLKAILTSPAHAVLLGAVFADQRAPFRVRGLQRLSVAELRRLSWRDTDLLRTLGNDSLFFEVLAGEPEDHLLDDLHTRYDVRFLVESLGEVCDLASIRQALRAHVFQDGLASDERISLPYGHLRHHVHPGSLCLELDGIEQLLGLHTRYPVEETAVQTRRGPVPIVSSAQQLRITWNLVELLDAAIVGGRRILQWIESEDKRFKTRDITEIDKQLGRLAHFVVRNFGRPRWDSSDERS